MILAPSPRIGHVHLVTQHIPYDSGLLALGERLNNGHGAKGGQMEITRQAATIAASEHLFEQLPKLTLMHDVHP